MDGQRFDDLTRSLAVSRRGVLRTLASAMVGGLLVLRNPVDGIAARPPRSDWPPRFPRPPRPSRPTRGRAGDCRGRPDFSPCGECGRCIDGQCVPDNAGCFECDYCDAATLRCRPIAEGESCGNSGCLTCQGRTCVAGREGEECGDCGRCQGGQCRGDGQSCGESACQICEAATGLCVLLDDGTACGGDCGRCRAGTCEPREVACSQCQRCDPATFSCLPADEGVSCDPFDCGACQGGVCLPTREGEACGECGRCAGGTCEPDSERCDLGGCQICDAAFLTCDTTTFEGVPCGVDLECGVCQGGACVAANEGGPCGNCGVCEGGICAGQGDCGECGACEAGECMPDNSRCAGECELCVQTGRSSTCIQAEDGSTCGECGECAGGQCVAGSHERCPTPACQACDPTALACVPFNDGERCGSECGVCLNGACEPDFVAGVEICDLGACEWCDPTSLTCEPRPDSEGLPCQGECGFCQGGVCGPDDTTCAEYPCRICDAGTFTCVPANEGAPCGEAGGTCQGGSCVEQAVCPPGQRPCGSCCYDSNPPACEECALIQDPSSPNGFRRECRSIAPRMTERCAILGEQFGIGLGFNPAVTCAACCALPGEPCFTQTARYLCCSGGTCGFDPAANASICP